MRRRASAGIRERAGDGDRALRLRRPPEGEEDVGLLLEPRLPAAPGGRVEVRLDDPVDERGEPLAP